MSTIPIRKWMDADQAVMESQCQFIWLIGAELDLRAHILKKIAKLDLDLARIDTDILLALTKGPSPAPSLAEHALVQGSKKHFVQQIATLLPPCPLRAL